VSEYRQESRRRWQSVATGWERHADAIRRDTMPVTSWMLDAIEPQPGHQVLEIAAGIGDTGFLAAELIEPGGTLTTSDLVPEMLSAAQRRAEALGVRNVRFRQIDAQVIDQPAASLDGVISRWGYMLMADAEAALRDTRRVLKPGGRLALAAWADPQDNPWTVLPVKELQERGLVEPIPPGPGQFAWAPEGTTEEHLDAAGFVEYEVESLPFTVR
jgi:ubiquinone/menaquinone biosynthesis C-methylase UbiE